MKKITSIFMTAVLLVAFLTGCGTKNRTLYKNINLADYVDVGNYLGLQVDTSSEEYEKDYIGILNDNIVDYKVSVEKMKSCVTFDESADSVVEMGDIVDFDYVSYKGETELKNGKDNALVIGSNSFVKGFEEQLIGVKVGDTAEISVTFPQNYKTEEYAGANIKFSVKVNSVAKTPEQMYTLLNFNSEEDYADFLKKSAMKKMLLDAVCENSQVKNFPKKDVQKIYGGTVDFFYSEKKVDITTEGKDKVLQTIVYPLMNTNMVMYYILDAENLEIYESTVESQNVNNAVLAESYAVQDIVLEYLLEKAVIK